MPFANKVKLQDGNLGVVECGLVVKHENEAIGIPLIHVSAEIDITFCSAEVTLTQTYQNTSPDPLNCVYFFPTETSVALYKFTATIGHRKLSGIVKEKETAREEFSGAVKEGKTAFLMEQLKPDIMELMVGNLGSNETCQIEICYIQELPFQDLLTRFTLPTSIAPRYIPASDPDPVVALMNLQYTGDVPLTIRFQIRMRSEINNITSPSHKVEVTTHSEEGWFCAGGTLEGLTSLLDRDFVLTLGCNDPMAPVVLYENTEQGEVAMVLSFIPETHAKDRLCEFVFVVDCSGSMSGDRIDKAREAMRVFIQSLPEDCYFNIVRFGTSYQILNRKSVQYNDKTLKSAKDYIEGSVHADLGGTEILEPLKKVLAWKYEKGYERQILILTDGAVSNTENVIQTIKNRPNKDRCRVFSLGIGDGVSRELVTGMAVAGDGIQLFCTTHEPMREKVIRMLSCACSNRSEISCVEMEGEESLTPPVPVTLFTGEKTVLYTLTPNLPAEITVHCSGSKHTVTSGNFVQVNSGKMPKLVAHKVATGGVVSGGRGVQLALNYQVVTIETAFVCVDGDVTNTANMLPKRNMWHDELDMMALQMCSLGSPLRSCPKKSMPFGMPSFGGMFRSKKKAKQLEPIKRSPPLYKSAKMEMMSDCLEDMDDGSSSVSESNATGSVGNYSEGDCSRNSLSGNSRSVSKEFIRGEDPGDQLTKLMDLADTKGRFSDLAKIRDVFKLGELQTTFAEDITATVLALVLLEIKFGVQRDVWYRFAGKSEKWLEGKISKEELKNLKDEMMSFVSLF